MKRGVWSQEEVQYLLDNYQEKEYQQIAKDLNRSKNSVYMKAQKLGLKKDRKIYNKDDIQFVKDNYEEPNQVLAEKLGFSIKTIQRIRKDNDIPLATKRVKYKLPSLQKWDEKTVDFIRQNKELSNEYLSKQLGISQKTIRRIRRIHDIDNPNTKYLTNTVSSAEMEVETILKDLGITEYDREYKVGRYYVDFVIGNKAIEVQGDYWHCNPAIYDRNNPTDRQKRAIKTDKKKKEFLIEYGFEVLWIWESEIEDGRAFRKLKAFLQSYLNSAT